MFSGQDMDKMGAKRGISLKEGARRRQNQTISLRDQNRKRALNEKRNKGTLAETLTTLPTNPTDPFAYDLSIDEDIIPEDLVSHIVAAVRASQDPAAVLHCISLLKRMLCRNDAPFEIAAQNYVPSMLIQLLDTAPTVELQQQVLGCLSALCAGSRAVKQSVVVSEGIPRLVRFLASQDALCREYAALGLGSLSTDSMEFRDMIVTNQGFASLMMLLQAAEQQSAVGLQNVIYAITGIVKHKPFPPLELTSPSVPYLAALLNHSNEDTVEESLWALSYISDGMDRYIVVMQQNIIPRVIELLRTPRVAMKVAAVRVLGNFCQGDDASTDVVVQSGCFAEVPALLQVSSPKVWKETLWMVSNIAAGTVEQNRWLASSGLVPLCIPFMERVEVPVKKEAMWIFTNLLEYADVDMANYLMGIGFINPYVELLKENDKRIILSVLNGIEYLLKIGELLTQQGHAENPYLSSLEANGAIDEVERLSMLPDNRINAGCEAVLELVQEARGTGDPGWYEDDAFPGGSIPQNNNVGFQ